MAYFAPFIDEKGINIPTYADIRDELVRIFKEVYGNDIYLGNDSSDYQMISAFALMQYDSCQLAQMVYNNCSPVTSVGTSLDRLCSINGVKRKDKGYSIAPQVLITGVSGTEIEYSQVGDINNILWQLPANILIPESGSISVEAICTKPGDISAPANTITKIVNPTYGWETVTNTVAAIVGSPVEMDSELRLRRKEAVAMPSLSIFDGIVSAIKALENVSRVKGYENDTGNTVDTVPPHSIAIVVEGGIETDIASIIYKKKAPGTSTFGATSQDVDTGQGTTIAIKFSRPSYLSLTVNLMLQKLNNWTSDCEDKIKQNLFNHISAFEIGESLYISNMFGDILSANDDSSNPAFYIKSLSANGQTEVVDVGMFEVVQISLANINISYSN